MILEEGKSYTNRIGETWKVLKVYDRFDYPVEAVREDGTFLNFFTIDGLVNDGYMRMGSNYDLIGEA